MKESYGIDMGTRYAAGDIESYHHSETCGETFGEGISSFLVGLAGRRGGKIATNGEYCSDEDGQAFHQRGILAGTILFVDMFEALHLGGLAFLSG